MRALPQQVNALTAQNAALEALLRGQQNIAQGLAELPGAITTVLNRAQAPTRRMLVFSNVRGALSFAVESQNAVTTTSVALGVPQREAELSTEIHGQLFIVLSALTDGESFDVVMSAGGDRGFESWRKLHRRWDPYTAGRARSLLREIVSPPRVKLPELMGAIERMEDLVRRYCGRRDAEGNVHSLAEDIRMSSLETVLPDDLEKHVQLNRTRVVS